LLRNCNFIREFKSNNFDQLNFVSFEMNEKLQKTIYVTHLSSQMSEFEIYQFFNKIGEVSNLRFLTNLKFIKKGYWGLIIVK
jgi:hypothetical protein